MSPSLEELRDWINSKPPWNMKKVLLLEFYTKQNPLLQQKIRELESVLTERNADVLNYTTRLELEKKRNEFVTKKYKVLAQKFNSLLEKNRSLEKRLQEPKETEKPVKGKPPVEMET